MSGTNPAQQEILDRLRGARDERPSFDAELRHHLRAVIEHGTAEAVAELRGDQTLYVSKSRLSGVHGCEVRFQQNDFAWSIPVARGRIAHKAIELSVHWRTEPVPLELVDEALARLENNDDPFGLWLQGLAEVERAELRSEAGARVTQFLECWPPLSRKWRPSTEAPIRQDLHGGRVVLSGKVDLSLGGPDGLVAGKVIVDLKTGTPRPQHFDDLRFYALVETMRVGTPPFRVASYYLDQGALHPEDVREAVLFSAAERVVDGVVKMIELETKARPPVARPSGLCRWCPVLAECDDGTRWLAQRDDSLGAGVPVDDDIAEL
jgi:hypothetical protein